MSAHGMNGRAVRITTVRPGADRWTATRALIVLVSVGLPLLGGCAMVRGRSDLAARIASARTPEDHVAIARSLSEEANDYSARAERHRRLAARYEAEGGLAWYRHHERTVLRMADHCRMVADRLDAAATELRALAAEHEQVANSLRAEER